jgi:hypothetical protein
MTVARTPTRGVGAPGALLELDEWSLRPLSAADYPLVEALRERVPADVFRLPPSPERFRGFLQAIGARPWSQPLACLREGEPFGLCFTNLAQVKNLNAYLVALFVEAEGAGRPIALYARHLFWNYPIHRFNAQFPLRAETDALLRAHEAAGFQREGVFVRHLADAAGEHDVAVLGLLRADLDAWVTAHEPRLALT